MNVAAQSVRTGAISRDEAIDLIWHEADLLDRLSYKPWLKLWTEAGLYIVPTERGVADHANSLNVVYDNAAMRHARVKRLLSGFSMSSAPPARTVRTISRFVVSAQSDEAIELRAAMMVAEYKYERMRVLAGDVDYRIISVSDSLKIDRKVVTLVNAEDFLHGMGYLL